jgi:hypothetical protein
MAVPQQEFKPMTALPNTKQEAEVMRWGGLAGMFGAVLFVLVFAIVGVFVGADAGPEGAVMRFPDVRAARTVENGLYLVVLSLWAAHFLALFQALRSARLAPAMFGTGLGILGLTVLAVGAIPHAASVPISDLYHSPGVSSDDQATLVIVWQATQGVFNALLVTGLLIVPMSVIMLGVAMPSGRQQFRAKEPQPGASFSGDDALAFQLAEHTPGHLACRPEQTRQVAAGEDREITVGQFPDGGTG